MNYKRYQVSAIYKETNRKRTREINAQSEEQVNEILKKQGYIEPFEIKIIPHSPPTDKQINYANDLGIKIPKDSSIEDVSALISRKVDYDREPNKGLIEFATNKGIHFSKYIGKKSLYNLVFSELDAEDKIAFFIFSIYRYLSDDRHANLDTSPHKELFYSFAKEVLQDESFMNSLNRYEGKELRFFGTLNINNIEMAGGSPNTIAYKSAANYLKENKLIRKVTPSTKVIKSNTNNNSQSADNGHTSSPYNYDNPLYKVAFSKPMIIALISLLAISTVLLGLIYGLIAFIPLVILTFIFYKAFTFQRKKMIEYNNDKLRKTS